MNKITRKSFLKVLAATVVGGAAASALTGAAAPVSIDETNGKVFHAEPFPPFIQEIIAAGGLMKSIKAKQ